MRSGPLKQVMNRQLEKDEMRRKPSLALFVALPLSFLRTETDSSDVVIVVRGFEEMRLAIEPKGREWNPSNLHFVGAPEY